MTPFLKKPEIKIDEVNIKLQEIQVLVLVEAWSKNPELINPQNDFSDEVWKQHINKLKKLDLIMSYKIDETDSTKLKDHRPKVNDVEYLCLTEGGRLYLSRFMDIKYPKKKMIPSWE